MGSPQTRTTSLSQEQLLHSLASQTPLRNLDRICPKNFSPVLSRKPGPDRHAMHNRDQSCQNTCFRRPKKFKVDYKFDGLRNDCSIYYDNNVIVLCGEVCGCYCCLFL